MQPRSSPSLILSGLAATTVIALTMSMARRADLVAALGGADRIARWPAPLWLVMLAALLATYAAGLGLGWALWGRTK